MATITKRGDRWQAVVRKAGVKSEFKTFDLKSHAEAWARKIEYGIESGIAGVATDDTVISTVFVKFRDEVCPTRKGERWESIRIDRLLEENSAWIASPADKFDAADLRAWRDDRLKCVTGSTVNREFSLISSVFSYAIKEGWIKLPANPVSLIRRPRNNKPRTQRVSDAQLMAIAGPFPEHALTIDRDYVAYAAYFALETAMRQGEICQLTWSDIDVENCTVYARDEWSVDNKEGKSIKNGVSREVPLSSRAARLINAIAAQREEAPMTARVFDIDQATLGIYWREMTKAADLQNITFHDLRREATTRMAAKIANVMELAAITGHLDLNVLQRVYYQPRAADLAARLG